MKGPGFAHLPGQLEELRDGQEVRLEKLLEEWICLPFRQRGGAVEKTIILPSKHPFNAVSPTPWQAFELRGSIVEVRRKIEDRPDPHFFGSDSLRHRAKCSGAKSTVPECPYEGFSVAPNRSKSDAQ